VDSLLPDLLQRPESGAVGADKVSLAVLFQQYFYAELAVTSEEKQESYRVRYRVYCEEFNYESPENSPGRLECDEFDEHSFHCLIRHRLSGRVAGCVRLVAPGQDISTPIEKYCFDSLDAGYVDMLQNQREEICEISRLAVDGSFRRRLGETTSRYGKPESIDVSQRERRSFSMIAVAAFLGAAALSDITGRRKTFAMMEPFLPRLLIRSGIKAHQAGKEVDYHGARAAYFMSTEEAVAGMSPELLQLYDAIHKNLATTHKARFGT
jgi:N-acyl amino acid synthase of PEP-CTERM/exosortase system